MFQAELSEEVFRVEIVRVCQESAGRGEGGPTKTTCADHSKLLKVPWFIPHPQTLVSALSKTLGFTAPETLSILYLFPLDLMTTQHRPHWMVIPRIYSNTC